LEVLTAVLLKIQFSWDVTPCGASSSRRFVIPEQWNLQTGNLLRMKRFWANFAWSEAG
jgi:hypothetical protein